jgi:hypothetical protein
MADFVKYFASDFFQAGSPNFLRIWELEVQKKNSKFFFTSLIIQSVKMVHFGGLRNFKKTSVYGIPPVPPPLTILISTLVTELST